MDIDLDKIEVVNNVEKHRFEAQVGDQLAVIVYRPQGDDVIIFVHTEVPFQLTGQGIASKMARTALRFAEENSLQVVPSCPFVAAYIRAHPEYQSLVSPDYRSR